MSDHAVSVEEHHHGDDLHHHDESSIFPAIVGLAVGMVLLSFALKFGGFTLGPILMMVMTLTLLTGTGLWWAAMVKENREARATLVGTPSEINRGLKIGFAFFIGSEVMFFAAFFAYYFYTRYQMPMWPPAGHEMIEWFPLPALNTALLLSSGYTFNWAHHNLRHGNNRNLSLGLLATIILGSTFLGVQAYEWSRAPFSVHDGVLGTSFFLLTGFHGAHVIIGDIFLTVMFFRSLRHHFTPERHFALEACGWYWHFVDVVWIGLFTVLYLM